MTLTVVVLPSLLCSNRQAGVIMLTRKIPSPNG